MDLNLKFLGGYNGNAKIPQKTINTIKKLWNTEKYTQKEIADRFEISKSHTSKIINKKCRTTPLKSSSKIRKRCNYCNKSLYLFPYRLTEKNNYYCNRKHFFLDHRITLICKNTDCSKKFKVMKSTSDRIYCSKKCKDTSIENRIFNAKLRRGRYFPKVSKIELYVKKLITEEKLPFKHCGNGEFIINGLNPDFIHKDKKTAVEIYGCHWHGCRICQKWKHGNRLYKKSMERISRIRNSGYKCFVIWEHDIRKNLEKVISKLKKAAV